MQLCPLLRPEEKIGHSGGVLTEVHHKILTRIDLNCLTVGILSLYDHLAVSVVTLSRYVLPYVYLHRCERDVVAHIYLRSVVWQYLSLELPVYLRSGEQLRSKESLCHTGVILLTVEDGGMLHRSGYTGFPVVGVCSVKAHCSVLIRDAQHSAERTLGAEHSLTAAGSDNLVAPPAGRNLRGELVDGTFTGVERIGDIIRERPFRLERMCETRLEDLLADEFSVDIQVVYTESRCHPFGTFHLSLVSDRGDKPAGSVGSARSVVHRTRYDRGVDHRNPFRAFPRIVVQRSYKCTHVFTVGSAASSNHCECRTIKHLSVIHHIVFVCC